MNLIDDVKLSEDEIGLIIKTIEDAEHCRICNNSSIRSIWLQSEDFATELRLLFLGHYRLTVSRVSFRNKRRGTMTKILGVLKRFCKENQVNELVVQSVLTREMVKFCLKQGFTSDPNTAFPLENGLVLGDYILRDF